MSALAPHDLADRLARLDLQALASQWVAMVVDAHDQHSLTTAQLALVLGVVARRLRGVEVPTPVFEPDRTPRNRSTLRSDLAALRSGERFELPADVTINAFDQAIHAVRRPDFPLVRRKLANGTAVAFLNDGASGVGA
jgi:hypothetical protein